METKEMKTVLEDTLYELTLTSNDTAWISMATRLECVVAELRSRAQAQYYKKGKVSCLILGFLLVASFAHAQTLIVVDRSSVTAEAKDASEAFTNHVAEEVSMGHVFDKIVRDFSYTPTASYAKKYPNVAYEKGASEKANGSYVLQVSLESSCMHNAGHKAAIFVPVVGIVTVLATPDCMGVLNRITPDGASHSLRFRTPHGELPSIYRIAEMVEKGVPEPVAMK